ncbi:MAG: hypothetical protein COA32_10950 [Fluviicola sp.]|nr:MAG: hypothetical protein COA32_10950 [Fluviicola sp.]
MDRAYRLSYCKKCTLRDFSPKQGIVCSLTNAPADFDESCESFKEDAKEAKSIKVQEELIKKDAQSSNTLGLSVIGIKSGVAAGIIAILGALVWFIIGLMSGYIFFYPPLLFILGVIVLIKGLNNMKKRKLKADEAILDSEL